MSLIVDIAQIIIALSLLILVFLLIRLLLEMRCLAVALMNFLKQAQADLSPIVTNLTETSERLRDVSAEAGDGVAKLSDLFVAIGEGAGTIRLVNSMLRSLLPSSVIGAVSFVAGVKAGLSVLMNQLFRRRKRE